jgi:glycine cleavage system regulatory protein
MTKYVIEVGGNVGESQATKLGSYFSLMMRVDIPKENVSDLTTALNTMHDMNATVFVIDEEEEAVLVKPEVGCTYIIVCVVRKGCIEKSVVSPMVFWMHSFILSRRRHTRFGRS